MQRRWDEISSESVGKTASEMKERRRAQICIQAVSAMRLSILSRCFFALNIGFSLETHGSFRSIEKMVQAGDDIHRLNFEVIYITYRSQGCTVVGSAWEAHGLTKLKKRRWVTASDIHVVFSPLSRDHISRRLKPTAWKIGQP